MKKFKELEMTVLDMEEVEEKTGLDSDAVALLVFEGSFPQPIVMCGQEIGWAEKEVYEWLWIKKIEASWGGGSRWTGANYSLLRHPLNVLGLESDIVSQVLEDVRKPYQPADIKVGQKSIHSADPFATVNGAVVADNGIIS